MTNKLIDLRRVFWPIENVELKKFLPLALIMFCILFNYTFLRSLKDSLIVPVIGAESISFLKLWGVLPAAIVLMLLYAELLNMFTEEQVFYIMITGLLTFFAIFGFYLAPNSESLHPSPERIQALANAAPNFKWFIYIYGKWTYALFYIFSDLWNTTMLSLLFWQFANKITTLSEAKRFYPMIGLISHFALVIAGMIIQHLTLEGSDGENLLEQTIAFNNATTQVLVPKIISLTLISGLVCIALYRWVHLYVLPNPLYYKPEIVVKTKKPTLKESFDVILHSKYLGLIALLVISYGISVNLIEGPWKSKIGELYPNHHDYLKFVGKTLKWMGVISIVTFIIASNIVRKFSWLVCAMMTPIIILIMGSAIFILNMYDNSLNEYLFAYFGTSAIVFAVNLGMVQNILAKSAKYSLFDASKEMAYIPLDNELKTKGKAAVEIVGGRLGKAGGAFIQAAIFTFLPDSNYQTISPYLMVIFLIITVIWIYAAKSLYVEYRKKAEQN